MSDFNAYRLYLVYAGVTSFLFALGYTVSGVYRVEAAGLDPLQLVLVGTTLEVTYFLFNVPTGIVADTYSRRLSVVIGVVLFGAGMAIEGALPLFGAILVAQVVVGLAFTFVEGALEAWLSDEVGEERVGRTLLRGGQVERVAGFVGIFASVGLASARLALPLLVAGGLLVLFGGFLWTVMREPHFRRPPRDEATAVPARARAALRDMAATGRTGARVVRRRPLALTTLAVSAVFGGYTEGFDRFWQAHFLTNIGLPALGALAPIVWFGVIEAGVQLLGIGAAELLRRRDVERPETALRLLFVLESLLLAGTVLFALAGGFAFAVGAYWLAATARSLVPPLYTAWLNQGLDPQVRATVLSMSGQADAFGQFTTGPVLGMVGNLYGLRAALVAAGAALAPAVLLYGRAIGRVGRGGGAMVAAESATRDRGGTHASAAETQSR